MYNLDTVKAAATDPTAARDDLQKVAAAAPSEIKSDAELIYTTLNNALSGKAPSASQSDITQASANVARYYVQHCR